MKLLLVDDSKAIRMANQRALEQVGYEVLCAEDGEAALKIAQSQPVDLILLDVMLPKTGGLQVLERLKSEAKTAAIPVIILSGLSGRNGHKLIDAGAEAYLEKSALMPENGVNMLPQELENIVCRLNRKRGIAFASVHTSH